LDLLGSRIGESGLGGEQIDDAAYSFAIPSGRDLHGLLRARQEVVGCGNAAFGGLQRVVRNEYLCYNLLAGLISQRGNRFRLCSRRRHVVLSREPVEDRNLKPQRDSVGRTRESGRL
jgi:hypothetical protein